MMTFVARGVNKSSIKRCLLSSTRALQHTTLLRKKQHRSDTVHTNTNSSCKSQRKSKCWERRHYI